MGNSKTSITIANRLGNMIKKAKIKAHIEPNRIINLMKLKVDVPQVRKISSLCPQLLVVLKVQSLNPVLIFQHWISSSTIGNIFCVSSQNLRVQPAVTRRLLGNQPSNPPSNPPSC